MTSRKIVAQVRSDKVLSPLFEQLDSTVKAYNTLNDANKARALLRNAVEKGDQKSYDRAVEMLQDRGVAKALGHVLPKVLIMALTHESGPVSRRPFSSLAKWAAGVYSSRGKNIWEDDIGLP